jgi:probable phosphoglycerate mutase
MTEIALLRHFPTDWNGEHRLQGRTDRPLTAEARAALRGLALPPPWDRADLWASTLSRARETAAILARGRRVCCDPRLVELAQGAWEGRVTRDLIADPASGYAHVERWGWHRRPPGGGESPADGLIRALPALAEIAAAGAPAVIVTHRALMRALLARAWGWDYDRPEPFEIRRGRLYPLALGPDGTPHAPGAPVRLAAREGAA